MLDLSKRMLDRYDAVIAAAEQFIVRLMPGDRARVGSFSEQVRMGPPLTGDRDALIKFIRESFDLRVGMRTRLWDGIEEGVKSLDGIEGRRVVLVFTDGDDTSSRISFKTVMERARDEEVMVYSIGLESEYFNGMRVVRSKPSRDLKKISDETGGGYFELQKTADLAPTFQRVAQELRSQYLIGFAPASLDNKVHKLEVRVNKPGMTVRARRSYLAAPDKPSH